MPSVEAVLIVRNESAVIENCIRSLAGLVDAVHVHDTGSTDETISIAKSVGAIVTNGKWVDDFSAARNAALAACDSEWVLSIDADETATGNRTAINEQLNGTSAHAFRVLMEVQHNELPYSFRATRLFRREGMQWVGRVHEQIQWFGGETVLADLASPVLSLVHSGYATPAQRKANASRNTDLARQMIANSAIGSVEMARAYVDLGRSLIAMGESQSAADAFEEVRSRFPKSAESVEATDFLTRLLLAEEMYAEALVLVQQLSELGASETYCDWLAAQVLVQLGRFGEAHALLEGVDRVTDTSGRTHNEASLLELKRLVAQLNKINPP